MPTSTTDSSPSAAAADGHDSRDWLSTFPSEESLERIARPVPLSGIYASPRGHPPSEPVLGPSSRRVHRLLRRMLAVGNAIGRLLCGRLLLLWRRLTVCLPTLGRRGSTVVVRVVRTSFALGGRVLALLKAGYPRRAHAWVRTTAIFLAGVATGVLMVGPGDSTPPTNAAVAAPAAAGTRAATLESISRAQSGDARGHLAAVVREPAVAEKTTPSITRTRSMTATAAFQGSLEVISRPEGATVYVNGRSVGTTPLVLRALPVGSRAVRIALEGYHPWMGAVQISTDRRTRIAATLRPTPRNRD